MLEYPNIDPILLQIGPFAIRWYSLAYIAGILGGFTLLKRPFKKDLSLTTDDMSSLMTYTILGVILGGRIGYILFYNATYYANHTLEILAVWNGGMSYHGGALGAVAAFVYMALKKKQNPLSYLDLLGLGSTLGIFFGRIANFINGELYGRITTASIGMIFPDGGPWPRHPSQLYEAAFEGLILGLILWIIYRFTPLTKRLPGLLFSLYLILYGVFRFIIEFFREPDGWVNLILFSVSRGQFLCLLMSLLGILLSLGILYGTNKARRKQHRL